MACRRPSCTRPCCSATGTWPSAGTTTWTWSAADARRRAGTAILDDAAQFHGLGHASHGDDVSAHAHVDLVPLCRLVGRAERAGELVVKTLVDLGLVPVER